MRPIEAHHFYWSYCVADKNPRIFRLTFSLKLLDFVSHMKFFIGRKCKEKKNSDKINIEN